MMSNDEKAPTIYGAVSDLDGPITELEGISQTLHVLTENAKLDGRELALSWLSGEVQVRVNQLRELFRHARALAVRDKN